MQYFLFKTASDLPEKIIKCHLFSFFTKGFSCTGNIFIFVSYLIRKKGNKSTSLYCLTCLLLAVLSIKIIMTMTLAAIAPSMQVTKKARVKDTITIHLQPFYIKSISSRAEISATSTCLLQFHLRNISPMFRFTY